MNRNAVQNVFVLPQSSAVLVQEWRRRATAAATGEIRVLLSLRVLLQEEHEKKVPFFSPLPPPCTHSNASAQFPRSPAQFTPTVPIRLGQFIQSLSACSVWHLKPFQTSGMEK